MISKIFPGVIPPDPFKKGRGTKRRGREGREGEEGKWEGGEERRVEGGKGGGEGKEEEREGEGRDVYIHPSGGSEALGVRNCLVDGCRDAT
jgi:hypothetical protein